jgi:hypothetical protein
VLLLNEDLNIETGPLIQNDVCHEHVHLLHRGCEPDSFTSAPGRNDFITSVSEQRFDYATHSIVIVYE